MKEKKQSRFVTTLLTILMFGLYTVYVIWLFWCQPFVACAADKGNSVPGGNGNDVYVMCTYFSDDIKATYNFYLSSRDDWEIIAYKSGNNILFRSVNLASGKFTYLNASYLDDVTGYYTKYVNGELTNSVNYSLSVIPDSIPYIYNAVGGTISYDVSGCKIFKDEESARSYVTSGSLDGMENVNVDMGTLDKNIGYLHDLQYEPLQYGETDENGIPESFDDCFTWSDFYPEYDDTYLVEVRASCEVEVKKWFGLSKGTVYNSDIRELAIGIPYKNLEFIISISDQRSIFSDFINEHMPDDSSIKSFGTVGAYQFDTYYFRIYKWDEELNSYRYGEWVRLTKDGTALMGSLDNKTEVGSFDKNGNWITNTDSDYGEGKPGTAIVGTGNTQDEAKEDADSKKDQIDSGDNRIDLSDTNFMELWEWFCKSLVSFWNGIGVIPEFFGRVFSFLPAPVIGFIGLGLAAAIILRICGR